MRFFRTLLALLIVLSFSVSTTLAQQSEIRKGKKSRIRAGVGDYMETPKKKSPPKKIICETCGKK